MKHLDGIVIPSGSFAQDLERVRKAEAINTESAPYIISGAGHDINKAQFDEKGYIVDDREFEVDKSGNLVGIRNLDVHADLYNKLVDNFYGELEQGRYKPFGVDSSSVDSWGNVVYSFPKGQEGRYAIVSYPLHLARFKMLETKLKLFGRMSRKVKLNYVPTKSWNQQTVSERVYGLISFVKDLLFRW